MTDAPELKPCPFCGGGARIYQDPSHSTAWFCGCEDWDCFGNMMWDETKAGATEKWNRRADLSSPLGAVAMRDAAAECVMRARMGDADNDLRSIGANIESIPLPTHADLLAAAIKQPEVAALVKAGNTVRDELKPYARMPDGCSDKAIQYWDDAIDALEAKP